jgi:dolichyl-phosphate beta-glucosyltransferase
MAASAETSVGLSVIIPAYNEAERIGESLERVKEYCSRVHPDHEVIVADDGSRDDTAGVVLKHTNGWKQLQLMNLEHRGKGHATRMGVLASKGEWILCTDADLSTPIEQVESMLEVGERHPIVIGSRSVSGASVTHPPPFYRKVMGRVFNGIVKVLAVRGYADTQCGFKLFRRDAARDIFSRITLDGFAFDVETLYLAGRLGYSVAEVPVSWRNDERTKVKLYYDPPRMFLDVLKIRWRHGRGR